MILCILQARMSSERLPGKVLLDFWGVPMLLFMLDRVKQSKRLDKIVVATSTDKSDNSIFNLCIGSGTGCFRGSLDDVLDRFYHAAMVFMPSHVVRLTGDCPLINIEIMDRTIEKHLDGGFDFTWNPGFPDGYDVEVMTIQALIKSWQETVEQQEREHVTKYIRKNPDKFRIGRYQNIEDMSHIKLSIDTMEDYLRSKKLIEINLPIQVREWLRIEK